MKSCLLPEAYMWLDQSGMRRDALIISFAVAAVDKAIPVVRGFIYRYKIICCVFLVVTD